MSQKNPGPIRLLAKAISEKKLTSTALIEETIRRLDASELNAVCEFSYESALKDAEQFDKGIYASGPLGGLPVGIKDLEDWKGHPTKKGSVALDNVAPAKANGVVPQRLFDAGAIGIVKTTLPEFAIEGFTSNLLTGATTNPWNQKFSTGGSSGGSAALVASGAVAIGTATDGGGSIRIPSSLCGLVGIKPTNGLVGRWPVPDWIDLSTDGPFATSTDDLKLLLDVIVGSVAGDPSSPRHSMVRELTTQQNTYTKLIVAERTSPLGPLPAGVLSALQNAAQALSGLSVGNVMNT